MNVPIFQTQTPDLMLIQTRWASILNPTLSLPILNGNLLQNVPLSSGVNQINHKLGRNLIGWFPVRKRSAGTVYDSQDTNPSPSVTLTLHSSDASVIDLWVF